MSKDRYSDEEESARFDAALKKALNVTGPRVAVRDLPGGRFVLDIDLNDIVKRGKDCRE